jgi:hypothetical protein
VSDQPTIKPTGGISTANPDHELREARHVALDRAVYFHGGLGAGLRENGTAAAVVESARLFEAYLMGAGK